MFWLMAFVGLLFPSVFKDKKTGEVPKRLHLFLGGLVAGVIAFVITGVMMPASETPAESASAEKPAPQKEDIDVSQTENALPVEPQTVAAIEPAPQSVSAQKETSAGKANAASTEKLNGCAPDDLQCLGDNATVAAGLRCDDPIEAQAKYAVRWTDGLFEPKFSHFRWTNKKGGGLTMIGDKVEFQNGFGAWSPMIYECDMTGDGKTVLSARVREGRLPK